MLDALLASLPDSAYFEQRNFVEDMRESLRTSEEPFACALRGPALWNTTVKPEYPFYSLCKTNTVDNPVFIPFKYGSIVISSKETGEILVYLAEDFGGKTPEPPIVTVNPKTKSNLPRAKTYSVEDHWRSLNLKELNGGFGNYCAFLHIGDFQSQPYPFQVVPDLVHAKIRPYESQLKHSSLHEKNRLGIPGASVSHSPSDKAIPIFGATLTPKKTIPPVKPPHFPIQGTFKFTGAWPKEYTRLPLHFLIGGQDSRDLLVKTLWLPRSSCQFHTGPDGYYSGQFELDLESLFITSWDGKPKLPKQAWISLVHRDWQGPIVKYDFD